MGKIDEEGKHKHDLVMTGPSHDNLNNVLAENSNSSKKLQH